MSWLVSLQSNVVTLIVCYPALIWTGNPFFDVNGKFIGCHTCKALQGIVESANAKQQSVFQAGASAR